MGEGLERIPPVTQVDVLISEVDLWITKGIVSWPGNDFYRPVITQNYLSCDDQKMGQEAKKILRKRQYLALYTKHENNEGPSKWCVELVNKIGYITGALDIESELLELTSTHEPELIKSTLSIGPLYGVPQLVIESRKDANEKIITKFRQALPVFSEVFSSSKHYY